MLIRKIALSCLAAVLAMSALAERADAFYSSAKGRFISRDPIAERGGLNLYGFVGNGPINRYDVLGEWGSDTHCNWTRVWFLERDFTEQAANAVGDADDAVDGFDIFGTGPLPWPFGDQSYHFNRAAPGAQDSRLQHRDEHLAKAKKYCSDRVAWWQLLKLTDEPGLATRHLGLALHPLQDWVAHGDYEVGKPGPILTVHNSKSPQQPLPVGDDLGGYPDNTSLDAVGSPDGRPAGAAIKKLTVAQAASAGVGGSGYVSYVEYDYAIYEIGNNRIWLTERLTDELIMDFKNHLTVGPGRKACACREYFLGVD